MTKRKMSDGERVAERHIGDTFDHPGPVELLAVDIDRLVRRRMAQAWDDGYFAGGGLYDNTTGASLHRNPYRAKRRGRA